MKHRYCMLAGLAFCAAAPGAASAASAAPSVIEGQHGWLFPGWERADKVDRAALAANIKLLRDALAARNINLLVMVVPAKAAFYRQRLPAGFKLAPEVEQRYSQVLEQLRQAGIATFDDRAILQSV